tara:strand:- start:51 stop:410 length:360 start_codon:yes stop_codon:yes gene_type:complete
MAKDYNSYTFRNKDVDNIQSRTNTANDPDDKPSRSERLRARGQKNISKGKIDKGMRQKARASEIDKKTVAKSGNKMSKAKSIKKFTKALDKRRAAKERLDADKKKKARRDELRARRGSK